MTIGSCMSEGILEAFKKNSQNLEIHHINHVIHNRSDYFLNCFVKKAQIPVMPKDIISKVDNIYSEEFPDKDLKSEAEFYLDNQSEIKIGKNRIESRISAITNINDALVDIFLLDNFMDIAAMLVHERINSQEYFIFSGAFKPATFNSLYFWTEYLSEDQSRENWIQIINWLRFKNPQAKIFFTPFPKSVYNHENKPSVLRARLFRDKLNYKDFPAIILSAPDVNFESMISIDDWSHYKPSYYKTIAEQITTFL